MEDHLLFLIGSPRSGSTLLARMLGAHSRIMGAPELHLLTPLAHLGYFDRVEEAPYDPVISQEGIRELVARLPNGESSYVSACRAYADALYRGLIGPDDDRSLLLEKTPAYALVLPFIAKLYPRARYVVLTRNPLAILSSQANSFFDGSYDEAIRISPILERYVPAIARFLRERPVELVHVRYEELVQNPTVELEKIFQALDLDFEPGCVEYGEDAEAAARATSSHRGLGDPSVTRHGRPVTDSIEKWATEIAGDAGKRERVLEVIERLDRHDLEAWGYPPEQILRTLERAQPQKTARRPALTRYRLERKLLVRTRQTVRRSPLLTRLLERLRLYCDLLLR